MYYLGDVAADDSQVLLKNMSNSDNPRNGAIFQKQVMKWFEQHYATTFILEEKIPIGAPAKDHKFDIVDEAKSIAI